MKKITLYLLSISLILLLSNCKKSNTVAAPNYPIVGLWIGSQVTNNGSSTVPLYYSFDLRSDSTILVQGLGGDGNTYYSIGKWSLSGSSFTATITVSNLSQAGVSQNLSATYSSSEGTLTAGIIQTIGVNYTATFTLDRIN